MSTTIDTLARPPSEGQFHAARRGSRRYELSHPVSAMLVRRLITGI